jgi:CRP/FNR family transcriptional regulator
MMAVMAETLEDLMAASPLFNRLAVEDRRRLGAVAEVRRYGRGDTIFDEGAPSRWVVAIAAGRVKVSKATPGGKDVILELLGAGDPLGAVAAYEGRPFPATAVAIEDTTCILLPRREFFALMEQFPTLSRGLLLSLTHRLMEMTRRIAELTGSHVEPRFARLFLKLADGMGRREGDRTVIPVTLTRQELADLTGTTIETCIRLMSRWNKQDIVRTEKTSFVLVDRQTLEVLAQC